MDISLIPTTELLGELKNRHDICFFSGKVDKTENFGVVNFSYKGTPMELKGLIYFTDMKVGGLLMQMLMTQYEGE